MSDQNKKRKNKFQFKSNFKKSKSSTTCLEIDQKGFVLTCNLKEKNALMECYDILNLIVKSDNENELNKNDDLDNELKKELDELKSEKSFKQVMTNLKNVLFIKLNSEHDPIELSNKIFEFAENDKLNTRFICKLIPIIKTVNVNKLSVLNGYEQILNNIQDDKLTYKIEMVSRINHKLPREEIIPEIANLVTKLKPNWKVNLKKPDKIIYLDILHKIAGLSILDNYFERMKYNLNLFCNKKLNKLDENFVIDRVGNDEINRLENKEDNQSIDDLINKEQNDN